MRSLVPESRKCATRVHVHHMIPLFSVCCLPAVPVGGSVELKVLFAPKEQIETGAKLTLTLFKGAQQLFDVSPCYRRAGQAMCTRQGPHAWL